MIDIKIRNVKIEDAKTAIKCVENFLYIYGDRRGVGNGVGYRDSLGLSFYVYRTDKTVVCVGQYEEETMMTEDAEPMKTRPFLVSALVEKPGMIGHRARVINSDSEHNALGSSLSLWQVDGWNVTSYEIVECNTVISKEN